MLKFGAYGKSQSKFLYLLIASIVFPVLAVSSFNIINSRQYLMDSVVRSMTNESQSGGTTINLFSDIFKSDILYLSQTPPVQGMIRALENKGIDPEDKSTYESWNNRLEIIFTSFINNRRYYDQLRYIDEKGNELVRVRAMNNQAVVTPLNQLRNVSSTAYFPKTIGLKSGEIYVSEINLSRDNGQIEIPYKPIIRYATPVYNQAGEKRGILIANILVERLFELADNSALNEQMQQQFSAINQDGYYLRHPVADRQWGFELNNNNNIKNDYSEAIVNQLLSGESGLVTESNDYIMTYNTIFPNQITRENPFIIFYKVPKSVVLEPINSFIRVAVIVTLLVGGIFIVFGVILFKKLVNSILEVVAVVTAFSSQIFATINQQERIANQQLSSVQETNVTMDELSASSQQSAQQAEGAVFGAKQALERVEQGTVAIQKALQELETLKVKVESIAEKILQLSEQTHQIGSVSDVVSDLSNQTNMLALNAAVEAVRAGEHGKGFAVVASEIRKLSDASQKSSQKINILVNDIQRMIQTTVVVTEEGTKNVESGVHIAHQTAQVFADVAKSIEQIFQSSQQIALTSNQQALAIGQVNQAMNNLTSGANETAKGISQIKVGGEKLNESTQNLKEVL
ncbi:methyl-accepting chemotaxis protein [Planktothrix paucivesiculata]|uniref:Methyl-accepting chemotaxis sensory transducer n=1 Tax=Planktothrix paucivesiculata PCC 9631 TaxID=671071 RepID=A0A7Z9BVD5_9CYAN|nr:methyl-accepting chemotaxis protein [Planktothrix paucivesiculata]VXD22082.1 Methyl-accepting chemotaxis sensory transducer [Planktothrix paucivesiculata PCC 9631]